MGSRSPASGGSARRTCSVRSPSASRRWPAYVVPASDDVWNAEVSNLGTLVGAICFLVGAILLLPPRAVGSKQAVPSSPGLTSST